MHNRIGRFQHGLGGVVALALVVLGLSGISAASAHNVGEVASGAVGSGEDSTGIVVHGMGKVTAKPDLVTLTIGVETRAPVAVTALKENNAKANALVKLLRDRKVDERDIQTSQLTIFPEYRQDGRRVTGYVVSNTVTVKLRKLDEAGATIDAAASTAGDAIRVQNIGFSIADATKLMAQARALAVKDAKSQAGELAKAAGVKLGPLRAIRGSSSNTSPGPVFAEARAASVGAAPVLAGSQEVTVEVDLVYDID